MFLKWQMCFLSCFYVFAALLPFGLLCHRTQAGPWISLKKAASGTSALCLRSVKEATGYILYNLLNFQDSLGLKGNSVSNTINPGCIPESSQSSLLLRASADQIAIVTECVHDSLAMRCASGSMWAEGARPTPLWSVFIVPAPKIDST